MTPDIAQSSISSPEEMAARELSRAAWLELFRWLQSQRPLWAAIVKADDGELPVHQRAGIASYVFRNVPAVVTTSLVEGISRIELVGGFLVTVDLNSGSESVSLVVVRSPDGRVRFAPIVGRAEDGSALVSAAPTLLNEREGMHVVSLGSALLDLIDRGMDELGNVIHL